MFLGVWSFFISPFGALLIDCLELTSTPVLACFVTLSPNPRISKLFNGADLLFFQILTSATVLNIRLHFLSLFPLATSCPGSSFGLVLTWWLSLERPPRHGSEYQEAMAEREGLTLPPDGILSGSKHHLLAITSIMLDTYPCRAHEYLNYTLLRTIKP